MKNVIAFKTTNPNTASSPLDQKIAELESASRQAIAALTRFQKELKALETQMADMDKGLSVFSNNLSALDNQLTTQGKLQKTLIATLA